MKCMIEKQLAAAGYVRIENGGGLNVADLFDAIIDARRDAEVAASAARIKAIYLKSNDDAVELTQAAEVEAKRLGNLNDALNSGVVVPGFGFMALDEAPREKATASAVAWKIDNGNDVIVVSEGAASGIWCRSESVAADYRPYTRAARGLAA
jgi:hypothetical protein